MSGWKKTFAIIWSGQLFSTLSSAIVGFAVSFWMSIETGSAEVLAYAMMATLLPSIVLGVFTGVYVDRWDRKRTMILADSFVAICSLALGLMFYFNYTSLWLIYILLGLRSVGSAFHAPAMLSSVPMLAPKDELMRVAGINQMIYSISNIAGPALGAICVAFMNMWTVMMLDVVGAIIACTSLLFVHIPNPEKIKDVIPNIWREAKEGVHYMFVDRGLASMFGLVTIAVFFILPISALYPLMTIGYFGGEEFEMAVLEICWGIGMLMGGVFISTKYVKTINRVMAMNLMAMLIGLAFWGTGKLPTSGFIPYVIITGLTGIGSSIYWSSFTVIIQTTVPPAAMGRVFSIYDSISLLPCIPGLLATGYIADEIGLHNAFQIAGICVTLVGVVALFIPAIRRLGINSQWTAQKEEDNVSDNTEI